MDSPSSTMSMSPTTTSSMSSFPTDTVPPHSHKHGTCPVTGRTSHDYCPPQDGDDRSPCPALNTLANHGYIPRSGRSISFLALLNGLVQCYNLSYPLALVLVAGGFWLCKGWWLLKDWGRISLFDTRVHGGVEHDASLVHRNCKKNHEYAPHEVDPDLAEEFFHTIPRVAPTTKSEAHRQVDVMTVHDISSARLRRERECPQALDSTHAEIARGEMGIAVNVFEHVDPATGRVGIPLSWLRAWMIEERLPEKEGWRRERKETTLRMVMASAGTMREEMKTTRIMNGEDPSGAKAPLEVPDEWDLPTSFSSPFHPFTQPFSSSHSVPTSPHTHDRDQEIPISIEKAPTTTARRRLRPAIHARKTSTSSQGTQIDSLFTNSDGDVSTPPSSRPPSSLEEDVPEGVKGKGKLEGGESEEAARPSTVPASEGW